MTAVELKQYIYNNNKIEYVLQSIGCNNIVYHTSRDYYSCSNARGGDCNNPAAINISNSPYLNYVNYTRNVSRSDSADLIHLVQYNLQLDFPGAMKYLHKLFGLTLTYKKKDETPIVKNNPLDVFTKHLRRRRRCNVFEFEPLDENILEEYVPYVHASWFREGIMNRTVEKFGLCYSFKQKRQIIPIRYWLTGELLATNSRTTIENYEEFGIKKYYISSGYNKSANVYGLWENYESIKKSKVLTIFEAEKSVLKRHSRFDETCIALQGHALSEEQIRIILGLDVLEIIIALDNDVSEEEVWHICEQLYQGHKHKISYIRDRWDLLQPKDSPADAPNKVYDFLYRHRTEYDEKKHQEYLRCLKK